MSTTAAGATFRLDSILGIMIRWRLAEECLSEVDSEALPSENALRVLVREDVPNLLKEVIRLRPDLA
jgi:hypothetical protein